MEFTDVIFNRYSCRDYQRTEINQEVLNEILEAGRQAPSAQNRQPWRYLVISDKQIIKKIAFHSIVGSINFFIKDAPIIIIACADTKKSLTFNKQEYYLVDVAISFQQMMLTAFNHGIGTCWLAAFNEKGLKDLLNIPKHIRVVGLSPFGYPKEKKTLYSKAVSFFAKSKKRNELSEICCYNEWKF